MLLGLSERLRDGVGEGSTLLYVGKGDRLGSLEGWTCVGRAHRCDTRGLEVWGVRPGLPEKFLL